jgi:hypothetical protein
MPSSGRRLVQLVVVFACLGLVATGIFATSRALSGDLAIPSASGVRSTIDQAEHPEAYRTSSPTTSSRSGKLPSKKLDQAQAVLDRQSAAVASGNRSAFLATIDPRAKTYAKAAARTFDNFVRMGVRDYRLGKPVEDLGAVTPARRRVLGRTAWVAEVDASYTLPVGDRQPWRTPLRMAFVERGGKTYVAADREGADATEAMPLWMSGKVTVVRGKRSLLIGSGSTARLERYAETIDRAVPRVTKVWGDDWAKHVVVIVPRTQAEMERVVGVDARSQGAVAAVTTSVGRTNPAAASHIVINPATFDRVGSLGRLVVLTHETTHVAAHATVSSIPVWLSEGFADYVGFHASGLPTGVVAQEFLEEVSDRGSPDTLPGSAQFDPQAEELDAAYEAAWTACRYIAEEWDEDTLVEFYRAMDLATTKVGEEAAYRKILEVTSAEFVSGWRDYVEDESSGG